MAGYALKITAAAIGLLCVGVLALIIFGNIWARVGIGAAIVIVCGSLLLIAWLADRREKAKRAELEDLPPA